MIESLDAPRFLCGECRTGIAPNIPDRCMRCSAPVGPYLDTTRGCVHCAADRFAFEQVLSLGVYDARLRSAVLAAKQAGGDVLTAALAELLARREADAFGNLKIELIVPVPHHWTDRLLRRHLPPVTFAARLSHLLDAPWSPHIIAKVRRTPPQSALEPTDRRNNLRGAFRLVGRPEFDGTRILLVDDVLTTGTTAHRAAALLKKAGARVYVAVLARGLGGGK
jgi:predicted amidophosphoribosyltransferase